jgi:hypothetical protein
MIFQQTARRFSFQPPDFIIFLPALLAGMVADIVMFGRTNETAFRRVVLIILLIAGLGLLV